MRQSIVLNVCICLLFIVSFSACDPCASLVCENATCVEGSCLCDDGYFKNGDNCAPINLRYIGIGTVTASQLLVDNQSTVSNLPDVELTLVAVAGDVYSFTLVAFNDQIKNDLVFTISRLDNELISTASNPQTTSAGNTYSLSGGRVGNQITLVISTSTGDTYTLQYVA